MFKLRCLKRLLPLHFVYLSLHRSESFTLLDEIVVAG